MPLNHPQTIPSSPGLWKNCLPQNWSLVSKRLGTTASKWLKPWKAVRVFTTCWDVAQVKLIVFIQGEAPGRFLLIPRVAAVGVSSIQLWEAEGGEGVRVGILGIPGLALAPRFGHTDGAPVVHACAIVALVIWNTWKKSPKCEKQRQCQSSWPAVSGGKMCSYPHGQGFPAGRGHVAVSRMLGWDTGQTSQWHCWEDLESMLEEGNQSPQFFFIWNTEKNQNRGRIRGHRSNRLVNGAGTVLSISAWWP